MATGGSDTAAGTESAPWATLAHAQAVVAAGDTVYVRGGTYAVTAATTACASQTDRVSGVVLSKSGSDGKLIQYLNYPGEKPVFDFSAMKDDCRIKGFNVTGSWIRIKGFEIRSVPQNNNLNHESWGVWISGSHNIFEQLDLHHHMGPGLFIQNGGYNLVLNSDSHHNYDPLTSNGPGESADGFGVHVSANNPGNVLRGCRAWWNSDDGFDLINAYTSVVIENSWAWRNGYLPDTTTASGNGNGFKAGGYGGGYDAAAVPHTVRFSVAFSNRANGFYANHHPVATSFVNNTAYGNKVQFNMLGVDVNGAAVGLGLLRNNVAFGAGTVSANMTGVDSTANSWDSPLSLSNADFQAVSTDGWDVARQADGSLPVLTLLRPSAASVLIDRGINVGAPYKGTAPDLGAFEYGVDMTSISSAANAANAARAGTSYR
ncbi:Right handed beta helix region [Roseateles sp. YR242]|nr:Right handed beta helix region [Roseateles sp. YR242]